MPFKIGWLDEKLHIYDIVLSDPFTLADQDQFFTEFFKFMDAGPVPMCGIFDVSRWSQSGAAGLNDPRFRRMGDYRKKIVVIVMVTKSKVTAAMGRLGAAVSGYRDWMRFEESREAAIKYLKERATTEMTQRGLLPKEQAQVPPAPAPKEQAAKEQAPQAPAGKVQAPKEQAPKAQVSPAPAPKEQAPTTPAAKVQAVKEQAPKVQVPPVQAPKEQAPTVPAAKVEAVKEQAPKVQTPPAPAPKEQAAKEQASKEPGSKDQAPKTGP